MGNSFELRVGGTYWLKEPPAGRPLPCYVYAGMRVRLLGVGEYSLFVLSPYGQLLAVPPGCLEADSREEKPRAIDDDAGQ